MDLNEIELTPKLLECSDRERKFVWAYLQNQGNATAAARAAGYADSSDACKVRGHELMHRERVLDALDEVGRKAFRGLLIPAIIATKKLIEAEKHPDHARVVQATLNRLGLVERTGVDVNVSGSVELNHTDQAIAHFRELRGMGATRTFLEEFFGHSAVARLERMAAELEAKRPVLELEARHDGGSGAVCGSGEAAASEAAGIKAGDDTGRSDGKRGVLPGNRRRGRPRKARGVEPAGNGSDCDAHAGEPASDGTGARSDEVST